MTSVARTANMDRFRSIIANRFGLHFEEAKTSFLDDLLRRRLEATGQSGDAYLDVLDAKASENELSLLIRELTVGETYFFRNMDQFRAFSEVVLPSRLQARASQKRMRILSAGCASGEEAYSLAILLREAAVDPSWDIFILAVDINAAMIDAAIRARFSAWALRETPPDVQRRWFRPGAHGQFALDPTLRQNIRFETRNLADDDPELWQPEAYDAVFCRNVIMYFTPEAGRSVVGRIARSLAPGGYLFLGHAETLRGLSQDFHLRHTHATFYYQRRDRIGASAGAPPGAPAPSAAAAAQPPLLEVESGDTWVETIRKSTERIQALADGQAARSESGRSNSRKPSWNLALPLELLQKEQFTEALDVMRALPPESTADTDALLLHAVLLVHRGQFTLAQGVCRRLLGIDELNAGAHYILALCHEGLGDSTNAANHDQVAVYLDPGFAMPHLHLGLIARRRGERAGAPYELRQALALLPREDASRLLLFGGGFSREALIALCRAELAACGETP